jgi:V8-like Glu-specific endopeptidase
VIDSGYLLDFAILQLKRPGSGFSVSRESVQLSDRDPENESLIIVGFPDAGSEKVSMQACRAKSSRAVGRWEYDQTDFGHSCSTAEGSSGSPVLDTSFRAVGLHHLGFDQVGRWSSENRAVRMARLKSTIDSITRLSRQ